MIRGSHTRSRIANGAGYPPAFTGQGNSQGIVNVSTGLADPAGFSFAGYQQDFGYNDSDPFGFAASPSATGTGQSATGLDGFTDLGGTTLANQSVQTPWPPYGVIGGTSPFTGNVPAGMGGKSGATNTAAATAAANQSYLITGAIFIAAVVGGYFFIRYYKHGRL